MRVDVSPEQVREAFGRVKHNPAFAESAAMVRAGRMPAEMIQAMCLRPDFLEAFARVSDALYPGGIVERDIKELIILEASRRNQCQFCTNSHIAIAKNVGVSDDPLNLLDQPDGMNERQRLAIEYTRAAMADSNRVPDELFERLRGAFTDAELVEITLVIGYIQMLNMFNNCLDVAYRGDYEVARPM